MRVFQELTVRCMCSVCQQGCLCGDCEGCSNMALDRVMVENAKRISALVCLAVLFGGFVYFAPVVSLASTPSLPVTFSMRLQQSTSTAPLGSISFCLFGNGAVLINGTYYPAVALNQSQRHICRG